MVDAGSDHGLAAMSHFLNVEGVETEALVSGMADL
jgi:hypothetical protein